MNEHDIVAYGWHWKSYVAEPTEPIRWHDFTRRSLDVMVAATGGGTERLFLRLRNGQIIRVKLKERHAMEAARNKEGAE